MTRATILALLAAATTLAATVSADPQADARAALALSQAGAASRVTAESNARAALALAAAGLTAPVTPPAPVTPAPCRCGEEGQPCRCPDRCECFLAYADAWKQAHGAGKPLVVWVRQPARAVPGCVSTRSDTYPTGGEDPCVVIGWSEGETMIEGPRLAGTPTVEVVRQASVRPARQGQPVQAAPAIRPLTFAPAFSRLAPVFGGGGFRSGGC